LLSTFIDNGRAALADRERRASLCFNFKKDHMMQEYSHEEIIDYAMYILDMRLRDRGHAFTSPTDTKRYLRLHFNGQERETFCVMFLDNQHRMIEYQELFQGTIDGASVHPREVVKASLKFNAAAVLFSHNHPSGVSEPSQADKRITERLKSALSLVDVRVIDHMIVGDAETYSFAEHGLI
tara:strand:- start:360 stop:902 length:543 start_codon:yes stop_codon:yes gene_type:complete